MKKHWLVGALLVLGAGCDVVLGIKQAPPIREQECRVWRCTGKTCGFENLDEGTGCSAGVCDNAGECRFASGASCTSPSQCATNQCQDSVCCETACTELCMTCNASGRCVAVAYGADDADTGPNTSETCLDAKACDGAGDCKLKSGQTCEIGSDCLSGHCTDGVCCDADCLESCKACNLPGNVGKCSNIPSGQDDENASQSCVGAYRSCDGQGACKGEPGAPCFGNGTECSTGYCADNVCCDAACTGTCVSCNLPGSTGTCLNVPQGQLDQNAAQPCNGLGETCDGSGSCKFVNGSACMTPSACFSGNCVDGVCCDTPCAGTCNACSAAVKKQGSDGTCSPIALGWDPENECGLGACDGQSTCKLDNGQTCGNNSQCLSGFCVDGVCCGNACTGTCMACTTALSGQGGTNGICKYIAQNLDPQNECTDGACGGNGTCKNDIGQACTADSDCLGNSCQGGMCTGPSCVNLAATCSSQNNESCCASPIVPGGTYGRIRDPNYLATVSEFRLDKFEVTVGRFRKFVQQYPSSKPGADAGAHLLIPGSGWKTAWNSSLPADQATLIADLHQCTLTTWTDQVQTNENLPINCIRWPVAFAFCAWDGGRLPTEAEWNRAAAGSNGGNWYPWYSANTEVWSGTAVFGCGGDGTCTLADIPPVGSKPQGNGAWTHADLGGSLWEWNLDYFGTLQIPCVDCAQLLDQGGGYHVARGGSWRSQQNANFTVPEMLNTARGTANLVPLSAAGIRCARKP